MGKSNANQIYDAVQIISQRREEWQRLHPGERYNEPECPKCHGTGLKLILRDFNGFEYSEEHKNDPGMYEYFIACSCTKNAPSQKLKNDKTFASVPGLYKDALMENFRLDIYSQVNSREVVTSAYNHVAFYINKFQDMLDKGIGLYIWSREKGSGKSRLASSISNELSNRGFRNKYASASTILSEIQSSWNDKTQDESRIINHYIKPELLIIDDFGARSGQAWMDEKFFMILDKRYQDNKPTILTSNFSIEKLPFNDQRIIDRLEDVDRFVTIAMPNESVRKRCKSGTDSAYYQMVNEERERREKEKHG